MDETINSQIAILKNATLPELQNKYKELFDTKETPCDNKVYLLKRIAYKLQEVKYGGSSETIRTRISGLMAKYDPVNNKALRPQVTSAGKEVNSLPFARDKRLPIPGTVITKKYKSRVIQVKVLEKGFEYNNTFHKSLSALSYEITGAHWNGYDFFGL
ncbi:MAG TPA: DUF2924 domain-containing protein [Candidatus Wunengus sp. YC60]|uniref:DUF2924 domain-containing protein n=1 Tax=Candidatus Wunengus sp. YC60 TaxID=3367697 RepID=UPI0040256812